MYSTEQEDASITDYEQDCSRPDSRLSITAIERSVADSR